MLRGQFAGIIGIVAGHLQLAGLQRLRDIVLRLQPGRLRRCAAMVSGFCLSCGAEGSQPMRSARTL